jgi:hypothetical protein
MIILITKENCTLKERLVIYIFISHNPKWHRDTKYKIYYLHNICTGWKQFSITGRAHTFIYDDNKSPSWL